MNDSISIARHIPISYLHIIFLFLVYNDTAISKYAKTIRNYLHLPIFWLSDVTHVYLLNFFM